ARGACTKGSGADTINVPTGSHDFSAALAGTDDNGLQGDLDIRTPMTIRGAGAVTTSVDAKGLDRVFDVVQNVSVTISRMTVRGGAQPAAFGGGIRNAGKLTLSGDIITDNSGFHGAGVDSSGSTLNIQGSAISNNPS